MPRFGTLPYCSFMCAVPGVFAYFSYMSCFQYFHILIFICTAPPPFHNHHFIYIVFISLYNDLFIHDAPVSLLLSRPPGLFFSYCGARPLRRDSITPEKSPSEIICSMDGNIVNIRIRPIAIISRLARAQFFLVVLAVRPNAHTS